MMIKFSRAGLALFLLLGLSGCGGQEFAPIEIKACDHMLDLSYFVGSLEYPMCGRLSLGQHG